VTLPSERRSQKEGKQRNAFREVGKKLSCQKAGRIVCPSVNETGRMGGPCSNNVKAGRKYFIYGLEDAPKGEFFTKRLSTGYEGGGGSRFLLRAYPGCKNGLLTDFFGCVLKGRISHSEGRKKETYYYSHRYISSKKSCTSFNRGKRGKSSIRAKKRPTFSHIEILPRNDGKKKASKPRRESWSLPGRMSIFQRINTRKRRTRRPEGRGITFPTRKELRQFMGGYERHMGRKERYLFNVTKKGFASHLRGRPAVGAATEKEEKQRMVTAPHHKKRGRVGYKRNGTTRIEIGGGGKKRKRR